MFQRFRRKAAQIALDSRPRMVAVRSLVLTVVIVLLAGGAHITVRHSLLREEARATKRYLRTLEQYNHRRNNELYMVRGERDRLARRDSVWHLAVRVGTLAARNGVRLTSADTLEIADVVHSASARHGVSPQIILGVIMTESGFDRKAISPKGAVGLMQLMPSTAEACARELGLGVCLPADLFDPRVNIDLGTYYLGSLIRRHQSIRQALISYNMGPNREGITMSRFVGQVRRHADVDL